MHIAPDTSEAIAVLQKLTAANMTRVEFWQDDKSEAPYGSFSGIALYGDPTITINEDKTVTLKISLREKSEIELRLDALEETQAIQNGAIEDLGMAVSELAEG